MPLLGRTSAGWGENALQREVAGGWQRATSLFPACANPRCSSSWLHLWRNRQTPVFEGGWNCSEACTQERIDLAIRREMDGRQSVAVEHHHRVPLGLLMLAEGWITKERLKSALETQKLGGGRLGEVLMREAGVAEHLVTRALSMQWSCPVFAMEAPPDESMGWVAPRLLLEAFGILPIRIVGGSLLYVGFEERIDHCVTLALERMTGLRVEAGLVDASLFARAHQGLLVGAAFPRARLIEARDADAMSQALSDIVERAKPVETRLLRVHDCYWMRLWHVKGSPRLEPRREDIEDIICSIPAAN